MSLNGWPQCWACYKIWPPLIIWFMYVYLLEGSAVEDGLAVLMVVTVVDGAVDATVVGSGICMAWQLHKYKKKKKNIVMLCNQ